MLVSDTCLVTQKICRLPFFRTGSMWRFGSHRANAQASEILYVIEQRPCFIAQGRIEIRFDIYAELPKIAIFIVVVLKFPVQSSASNTPKEKMTQERSKDIPPAPYSGRGIQLLFSSATRWHLKQTLPCRSRRESSFEHNVGCFDVTTNSFSM